MFFFRKRKNKRQTVRPKVYTGILATVTDNDKLFLPKDNMDCLNDKLRVFDYDKAWQLLGWFFGSLNRLVRESNLGGSCRVRQQLFSLERSLSTGMIPLLPTYKVAFSGNTKQFHEGLVIYPDVVSKGASGSIRLAKYNDVPIVIKVPRSKEENSSQLVESMIHSLLVYTKHKQAYQEMVHNSERVRVSVQEYPVAEIYFVAKSSANLLFVGIQKLHKTLTSLIEEGSMLQEDFLDILMQVTTKLYFLQEIFGFMHRDLHTDNIMVIKRTTPIEAVYEVERDRRVITSRYRAYFIDFGMSCVDFSRCGACNWESAMTPGSPYDLLICEQVPCQNYSFDLRYLLGFIHTNLRSHLPFISNGLLNQLMYQTVENIDISMYPQNTRQQLDRHKKIATAINVHEPTYMPLEVLRILMKV